MKNKSCAIKNQNLCIPFQYANDGCYARAHMMRKHMNSSSKDCYKIFAYGNLRVNTSTTGESQYFSTDETLILNSWVHVAWVRSGNNKYFYYNGTRYLNNTAAIGSIDANTGFIRILRGENVDNDGTAGAVQDFRVYIGTDKGYTGSTITTPSSIVEYLA